MLATLKTNKKHSFDEVKQCIKKQFALSQLFLAHSNVKAVVNKRSPPPPKKKVLTKEGPKHLCQ